MRFKVFFASLIAIILIIPTSTFAAAPNAGAACKKLGLTQNYSDKKFTCIKSGKKLVWNKGVKIKNAALPSPSPTISPAATPSTSSTPSSSVSPTPSATATSAPLVIDWSQSSSTDSGYRNLYKSWCDYEEQIPEAWQELQKLYREFSRCGAIYHLDKYYLGSQRPSTALNLNTISADSCKISDPENARNNKGFPFNFDPGRRNYIEARRFPGPKVTIQVLPIYSEDSAAPKNSPKADYGRYLNFLTEWMEYSSDVATNIAVRFPDQYLKFDGKLSDYKVFHENNQNHPEHQRFNRDLISQLDSKVDFTGVDLVYVVAPAGTPLNVLEQGVLGEMRTAEGVVKTGIAQYSYTPNNFASVKFHNFLVPYWWIHETYHGTVGLDDHYGENATNSLGGWSLMSRWGGDLSAWEKWFIGFYSDAQVNCVAQNTSATTWLAPSSVKTSEKKLTVIPISKYKAVVIESIRAAGLYYKIPKSSHGVLVYEVDLQNVNSHEGYTLVLPTNRDTNKGPFPFAEATLRLGESVVTNGQKITVIESGNFGDVVKVEKA